MTTQHDTLAAILNEIIRLLEPVCTTMPTVEETTRRIQKQNKIIKLCDEGLEHLTRIEAQRGWQPISTAPKDENRFLAVVVNGNNRWVQVLRYSPPEDENGLPESYRSPDGAWYGKQCVTHWQYLPPLPPLS